MEKVLNKKGWIIKIHTYKRFQNVNISLGDMIVIFFFLKSTFWFFSTVGIYLHVWVVFFFKFNKIWYSMSAWRWGRPFPRVGGGKPWSELVLRLCCPRVAAGEPDTRAPRRASTRTKLRSYFPFSPIHGLNLPHSWTRGFCGSSCQDEYGNAICSRC